MRIVLCIFSARYVPELTYVHKLSICADRHLGTALALKWGMLTCPERVGLAFWELDLAADFCLMIWVFGLFWLFMTRVKTCILCNPHYIYYISYASGGDLPPEYSSLQEFLVAWPPGMLTAEKYNTMWHKLHTSNNGYNITYRSASRDQQKDHWSLIRFSHIFLLTVECLTATLDS